MEDQQVAQHGPSWSGKECHEVPFHGDRRGTGAQPEPVAESHDVRIDDDPQVHAECISQDDVCSLSCYATQ